jgi:hypothetical protein
LSALYEQRVVGYLDILGVSQRLADPSEARRYAEAVSGIIAPIIADKEEWVFDLAHVDDGRRIEVFLSPLNQKSSQISFISDTIVISRLEVETDNDLAIGSRALPILDCLEYMMYIQRALLMLGLPSRGALTRGGLIHSGELLVGDGLVRAYRLEREQALYPRAIIDPIIIETLLSEPIPPIALFRNRVAHCVRRLSDGVYFVDYMGYDPMGGYSGLDREISKIFTNISRQMRDTEDDGVKLKLGWLLQYLDAVMDDFDRGLVFPRNHADSVFCEKFYRTNDTIVSYLKARTEDLESNSLPKEPAS